MKTKTEFILPLANQVIEILKEVQQFTGTGKYVFQIFMTLTLPSAYHKMKMDKKTNILISNSKYNFITQKDAVKHLTKMFSRLRHDRSLNEIKNTNNILITNIYIYRYYAKNSWGFYEKNYCK